MTGNRILDELPPSARPLLQKSLVSLSSGERVLAQGEPITEAVFPTSAMCSLVIELASGGKAETALVGSDGFVGVPLVLGGAVSDVSGVIQVPGEAYRLPAKRVLELCKEHQPFRHALFIYSAFRLHLASRTVACNSFHSIQQRMARWLLFVHDRVGRNDFRVTHEDLSAMLAATRPRVSQAAARLKESGIIEYRRGTMRIVDRQRLEAIACECYGQTKRYSTSLQ
ncbi:MAG TPA: Crp/Fnr family transcriptional regulator [Burkholderiales bacterium]|nr:Crp/Fnr family transcriptional regulator [Burkholderiales bacterium]